MKNKAARLPLAIGLAALIATEALSQTAEKQTDPFTEIAEGVYVLSQPDPGATLRMTKTTQVQPTESEPKPAD